MKRIKDISYLLLGIIACIVCGSCSLDEHPRDQIAEEEAYTTATALYQNTIATLYSYIGGADDGQGLQGTCRGVYDLQTFGSDEAMIPTRGGDWYDGGIWQDMYKHSWSSGHVFFKNAWLYLYKVITLCNHSLMQIDRHQQLLTDEERKAYTGEVRALRAIYYWYLLDLFGNVPVITSADVSIQEVKQKSRAEVFQFVCDELNAVYMQLSSENSVKHGDFYSRITRPVALFVLAKLMLNAEVYCGVPHWKETIACCDLLESQGYQLEDDYRSNFAIRNENSSENIFVIALDKDLYGNQQQNMFRSYHYRQAAAYGFTGENGSCATRKVLEVFGYGTDSVDNRFDFNYWADTVTDLNSQPVTDRMGLPLKYYPWEVALNLSGSEYVETAGARMKKYEIDKNATKDGKLMDNDIVLFRYADVLLMRAEARLRLGQDGQADYDAVRRRAGMGTRPLTLQNLLDERLLELCWEGWRRQDLIRFGQYRSLYGEEKGHTDIVDETDGHTTLYPIPADIITLNSNLVQNEGY
ncbi:MAG: RagB/SusD family nutrient uptake outer membrane protein [Prevotella sp.]|nr:RagB/SusD family nutrient uptake outer membrane protein [Prevotella sp.]